MKNIKIVICLLLIIALGIYCYIKNYYSFNNEIITVNYSGIELNCNNFTKTFEYTKTIMVENNTDNVKVYSLKWIDVENTLIYQDKFLYEIECDGNNCNTVASSQIPIFDFTLLSDIYIEISDKQKYTITFTYKGEKDEYGYFKGKFIIKDEIINKQKYEEYIKKRNQRIKNMDKVMKEYQKLDDK